ncbi:MAG: PEP-CTERM-box response regulator transcription factor [Geminicoccaceae bacterium]
MARERRKLLIVEDDEVQQDQLRWLFSDRYDVLQAHDRQGAITLLRAHEPGVVLLDLGLPPDAGGETEGMAAIRDLTGLDPTVKVVVMTGQGEHQLGVRSVGLGAYDFMKKPIDRDVVGLIVNRAQDVAELERKHQRLLEVAASQRLPGLLGDSPAIQQLCRMVEKVAPADVGILLLGESGTGKEVLAKAIHGLSPRSEHRFVTINCAAIPEDLLEVELFGGSGDGLGPADGKIEQASGGTLFLDEIGDLPLNLQTKLLRFLGSRSIEDRLGRQRPAVDVRVICSTHRDLEAAVRTGRFREDLFYRLNEVVVRVPPLRERSGDAVMIARHLLGAMTQEMQRGLVGFSDGALRAIDNYEWPGNIRELRNRVKRAVIMAEGRRVTAKDLELSDDPNNVTALNLRKVRDEAEMGALKRALATTSGNISKAARLLGISRPTFYDLMRQHDLRNG